MGFEDKVAIDPHPMGLALQANNVASLSLIRFKERVSLTLTQLSGLCSRTTLARAYFSFFIFLW